LHSLLASHTVRAPHRLPHRPAPFYTCFQLLCALSSIFST
jgi:hypothetical protein